MTIILVICVIMLTWRIDDMLFYKRNGIWIALTFMVISFLVIIMGSAIVECHFPIFS